MNYGVYFKKASLKSYFSLQFIVAAGLFAIGLFEGALSVIDLFLYGAPFLTFAIFYVLRLYYPMALPYFSILLVTFLLDVFFTSLHSSHSFAILISLLITTRLLPFPDQKEFLEIWQGFAVAMVLVILLQSVIFMITTWSLPHLQGLLFQFGMTLLLYPFIHVVVVRLAQILVEMSER